MPIEIRVPKIESAAYIGRWFKRVGDPVTQNEPLVEIEIGIGKLELPAPVTGVLSEVLVGNGKSVQTGTILGIITQY